MANTAFNLSNFKHHFIEVILFKVSYNINFFFQCPVTEDVNTATQNRIIDERRCHLPLLLSRRMPVPVYTFSKYRGTGLERWQIGENSFLGVVLHLTLLHFRWYLKITSLKIKVQKPILYRHLLLIHVQTHIWGSWGNNIGLGASLVGLNPDCHLVAG